MEEGCIGDSDSGGRVCIEEVTMEGGLYRGE